MWVGKLPWRRERPPTPVFSGFPGGSDGEESTTEYVNANAAEASQWIAELGIVAKAPLAQKAIPACNIVMITGEEMKTKVSGYLTALFEQNPAAVGGALPDDAFYLIP